MNYISTRGTAPILNFEQVLLAGLASDGGLYVPQSWPTLSTQEIRALAGQPYGAVAQTVMQPFIGDFMEPHDFRALIDQAYGGFNHPAIAPLMQSGANEWLLELHHGPTLAFKDVAMQLIGQMLEAILTRRAERVTIVGATSGDTGSAAIEAFRGLDAADVFILYPEGRVSEVQRRQMTTP
ncbi:MAG: threonine synthase, partial [Hyphomicrobiales bacterium]